jgi:hypothetical protein
MELLGALIRNRCYIWLPGYLRDVRRRRKPNSAAAQIDVMVVVVDHFEPSRREGDVGVQKVREWCDAYAQLASRHQDSDGIVPQHTWFYRYDYPRYDCLQILGEYVLRRFGEIEFHLHHGHDTSESFEQKIRSGVEWFNTAGAMCSAGCEPQKAFAYIAGNWALDNGRRDDSMSGVNNELEILAAAGCYADFTFPAYAVNAQPRMVNSIYYATDTPGPKSYDTGVPMRVGGQPVGDLTIFEGPTYIDWRTWHIEHASLETWAPYLPRRLDYWLNAGVHVQGRPEWLFIKLHTHGMQSREMFLGPQLDQMFSDLEARCKQGPYRLHYVTAREAYNIAKAAEAGLSGNPHQYRDYRVARPVNRGVYCDSPYRVDACSDTQFRLTVLSPGGAGCIRFHDRPILAIEGRGICQVEIAFDRNEVRELHIAGDGECNVRVSEASARQCLIPDHGNIRLPYVYRQVRAETAR